MNLVDSGRHSRVAEPASAETAPALPEGSLVGPYRVLSLIASGGMGQVYRARDSRLGRDIALKVLPHGLTGDRERVDRFAQEAKAASALNHPHIVAIYEIGQARPSPVIQPITEKGRHDEVHYIAMELVEGVTLREFLASSPSLARSLEILAQTAEGLGKAHAAGIVHRDLKPDNVMVSSEGYAKIVDFGLAKLVEPTRGWNPLGADSPTVRAITQQGDLMGTAGYMSPEHILGRPVDQRSDIFSFGCMLQEAITGRRPFEGDSFVDTLHSVLHDTPPPIGWSDPVVRHDLQRIVSKCLIKDREQRYQSIRDVAIDLRTLERELEAPHPVAPDAPAALPAPPRGRRIAMAGVIAVLVLAAAGWIASEKLGDSKEAVTADSLRPHLQRVTSNGRVGRLAISGDGRFAAYTRHEDGGGESVWLHQLATGSHVLIAKADPKVHYAGLAFTTDANHLLMTRYMGSIYGVVDEVPILGGAARTLVRDADTVATPSPDGKRLAVIRNVLEKGESHVLVAERDGGEPRILAKLPLAEEAMSPSWSPDGTQVVVALGKRLSTIDVATGAVTPLPLPGWEGWIREVMWSRTGDALYVSAADEQSAGRYQLLRVDPATGAFTLLTGDEDEYGQPRTGADSLAAVRTRRQAALWSAEPGAASQQLTRGVAASDGVGGVAWTPDGRLVYSSSAAGSVDLWIANADGTGARPLTSDDRIDVHPVVVPDGSAVLYLSSSNGRAEIRSLRLDGSSMRTLATAPMINDFTITPDSRLVIYASPEPKGKRTTLQSVPLAGGSPSTVAVSGVYVTSLSVTPDGGTLVFSALDENSMKLFRVPVAGGTVSRMTEGRAIDAAVSPDGSRVAYAVDILEHGSRVAIVPIEGGKSEFLELGGRAFRWSPDGRSIVFIRADGATENLYAQPLGGGEAKVLTDFREGSIANFRWSPDGKRLVVTHVIQTRDVVLVGRS